MAANTHGLDSDYIGKNLKILLRDIENYSPHEMGRALSRLSDACTSSFVICEHCTGHNTKPMRHDASRHFCYDCDKPYELKHK